MKLTSDRNNDGRFTKGHSSPGPGNPHVARVAQLRTVLIQGTSVDDVKRIWACILSKASDPDDREQMKAAELVFDRVLGRPVELDVLDRIAQLEEMLADARMRLTA